MEFNYNLNHKLLQFPLFKSEEGGEPMSNTQRMITFIVFSQIVHWTNTKTGYCALYKAQLSDDLGPKQRFFSDATKMLEKWKYIKCIKPHQRVGSTPGHYIFLKGSIPVGIKLYPSGHLAPSHRSTVNNYNNNYKENDSSYKESSPNAPVYLPNLEAKTTWNETNNK